MLAALGVVYGDIGTSPLYAFKESISTAHGVVQNKESILGILSLIVWTLTFIVTIKYVWLVLRANHHGEGGVLSLQAMAKQCVAGMSPAWMSMVGMIGLVGATMFYGDALITPAISVLSAIEGLEVATPALKPYVLPITLVIIVLLFAFQFHGTAKVGKLFGPIVIVWFATLGALGAYHIAQYPQILAALNPWYGMQYVINNPGISFVVLGSVFLAVTGAEALYADMGHFGAKAVRLAWLFVAMPGLVINYFGQGALVLANPEAAGSPLFMMVPTDWVIPLVILAAAATVIASQATIAGAYSMTVQAMGMGYLPRMKVVQTSSDVRGQVYLPLINWLMLAGVLALVVGFKSSSALASAYGIAITVTMLCTTMLFGIVAYKQWKWPLLPTLALLALMLALEIIFFASNMTKLWAGGWVTLLISALLIFVMSTWARGQKAKHAAATQDALPLTDFVKSLVEGDVHRVQGTAVYLTADADTVPHALLHNLKHNQVLHKKVVVLEIHPSDLPRVPVANSLAVEQIAPDFWRVKAQVGFMETVHAGKIMALFSYRHSVDVNDMNTSYFISRTQAVDGTSQGWWPGQFKVLRFMQRNASRAASYFNLPDNHTVEFGRST
ncbi:potassium transporter Kup [Variovorax sp. PCZ-1]|nr:potassium transporter Kup [Variovorax sp. PCZ-1]